MPATDKNVLAESAKISDQGQKFRIRLISEGTGSSATYPGDVLERDGSVAFPVGTQIFFDHLTESDRWDRDGNHSIRDLVGVTLTEAQWNPEDRSLNADARFFGEHAAFISEAMEYVGLSVEVRDFDLNESGAVERLGYSPLNAISVVPRAGRDGKVLALMESYRENRGKISDDGNDGKEGHMKPEDIQALVEGVVAGLKTQFDELREALVPATAVAEEAEKQVDRAEIVEAAVAAGLTKTQRTRVLASVESGKTLEEALADEKALAEEILKESAVSDPGVIKTTGSNNYDFTVSGW